MKRRSTAQLVATYDAVACSTDHPTADQILKRVRGRVPQVSLGTVYRNLEKLQLQGRLRMVRLAGGGAHYDAVLEEHDHFICESCGTVRDLDTTTRPRSTTALQRQGYLVRWQTTAIHGLCPECHSAGSESAGRGE
jgi:Fe2+ or Zn2+ uptake regulation protein